MPEYLKQDLSNPRGYAVVQGRPKATEAAVALTREGVVVFGTPGTGRATYAKPGSPLIHYDDEVERQRRLVCDTALGQLILDHPRIATPAVNRVSRAIESYWRGLKLRLGSVDAFKPIVETDGKYVSNKTSFGRLPEATPSPSEVNQFSAKVDIWLTALQREDLPQILTLHDTFLKIYCRNELDSGMNPMAVAAKFGFREDWYDKAARGRGNVKGATPSSMPGLITHDFTIPFAGSLERCGIDFDTMRSETRNRGTDMFMIEAKVMRPEFRDVLGDKNLVFAASASGTTSTLLASANTFSPGLAGETLKQYLMACIAYLVGGGMHTSHEVFYTGGLAGLDYTPGKYLAMLPTSFTSTRYGEKWQTEFWELVRPDRLAPR